MFRAYPAGVDTFKVEQQERSDPAFVRALRAYNDFNRRIYERVHHEGLAGRGVAIGFTESYRQSDYGEPIVALKSYILGPS